MRTYLILSYLLKYSDGLTWNYDVLNKTGKDCPERDSCNFYGGSRNLMEKNWEHRNCFCDDDCAIYGDCCIDASLFNDQEQKENIGKFQCKAFKSHGDIYVKSDCAPDWDDEEIMVGCHSPPSMADPFGQMPVTNTLTNITYSNYYCAICNRAIRHIEFWRPQLECNTLKGYNLRFKNLTRIRPCNSAPITSSCPSSTNEEMNERCLSYTALVYSTTEDQAYRNTHCALCNNVSISSLICLKLQGRTLLSFHDVVRPVSFAVLVDISGSGDKFDIFYSCRNLVCGKEGLVLSGNKCLPREAVPITTTTTTTSTTSTTTATTTALATHTPNTTPTIITTRSSTTTTDVSKVTTAIVNNPKPIRFPTENIAVNIPKQETVSTTVATTTTAATTTNISISSFITTHAGSITKPLNTNQSVLPASPVLQTCPQIQILSSEFSMLANRSVHLTKHNTLIAPGHYRTGIPGSGSLYICAHDFVTTKGQEKFPPIMGYVTFACLGVSLVCLILHLLISIIAPELQNLSGKNLFSLCLALFGAYCSFLMNMFTRDLSDINCLILAVVMYYFYLSAFFWMLNIAFEVARTLKLAAVELRLSSGSQWGRFCLYSISGWLGPGLLVTTAVVLDQVDLEQIPQEYKPGFGNSNIGICWFSSRDALLVYFVIPLSLVLALNVTLFLYSSYLVWEATRSSAKITTSWISGVIAGGLDSQPVWYVFLVLNTLQGLFILVFFTCSKKVVSSVRERLCGGRVDDDSSADWRWNVRKQREGALGSRDSQDSALSSSTGLTSRLGPSHARTLSTSSYDQYHQYDQVQRFYS